MKIPGSYFVYILASKKHGTLYIGVRQKVRRHSARLHGRVCLAARGHPAREAAEGMASGLEDQIDRARKSRLGRSIASSLTFGVWAPAFAGATKRDASPHISASILSPQ